MTHDSRTLDVAASDAFLNWLRSAVPNDQDGPPPFLTRYADVVAALREEGLVQDNGHAGFGPSKQNHAPDENAPEGMRLLWQLQQKSNSIISRWFAALNPPEHTRIRGVVAGAFGVARAEAMRPRIQALADELLDHVQPTGEMELISDLVYPLLLTVICEMMGLAIPDRVQFRQWTTDIIQMLDLFRSPMASQRGRFALLAVTDYVAKRIAERRKYPDGDDIVSLLLQAEQQGKLSADEVLANSVALLFAGQETTVYFIANATLTLLTHRDQLELLRAHPEMIAHAVEELLRFDTTGQITWRKARRQVHIADTVIEPGQGVLMALCVANRDPAVFANPDELDLTRHPNHHLAFGFGIHYCLGAPTARVEAQVVLGTLLRRMPQLALRDNNLEWEPNVRVRGLKALHLTF